MAANLEEAAIGLVFPYKRAMRAFVTDGWKELVGFDHPFGKESPAKPPERRGQSRFAPPTAQNEDSPRRFFRENLKSAPVTFSNVFRC
jgi:hypothetical protein